MSVNYIGLLGLGHVGSVFMILLNKMIILKRKPKLKKF